MSRADFPCATQESTSRSRGVSSPALAGKRGPVLARGISKIPRSFAPVLRYRIDVPSATVRNYRSTRGGAAVSSLLVANSRPWCATRAGRQCASYGLIRTLQSNRGELLLAALPRSPDVMLSTVPMW